MRGRFAGMRRSTARVLVAAVVLLVGLRAALPWVIQRYVLDTLNGIPGYRAVIQDIDLCLLRGAYQIEGLEIVKTGGAVPVPFFKSELMDLSIQWREIFRGALVGEVYLTAPALNFVDSPRKERSQTKIDASWQDRAKELFPLDINLLEVRRGEVHFQNLDVDPRVDLYARDLEISASNLTNSLKLSKSLMAFVQGSGRVLDQGKFSVKAQVDPYQKQPTFQTDFKLEGVPLNKMNDFFLHYGGFNVEGGTAGVYLECAAKDGKLSGYVKPILEDLRIVGDPKKELSPGQRIKEFFVAVAAFLSSNRRTDTTATRVYFEGDLKDPAVSVWSVIGQSLRHAFVKALKPDIEDTVDLKSVE